LRTRSETGDRADGVKPKLELGHDAEVSAATAHAPEKLWVLRLARLDELAIGGDQLDREELVDRQPMLSMKPADATAERQACDAGVADEPAGRREPECLLTSSPLNDPLSSPSAVSSIWLSPAIAVTATPRAAPTDLRRSPTPALQERERGAPAAGLVELGLAPCAKPFEFVGGHQRQQPLL
jgi:hypothetical protein